MLDRFHRLLAGSLAPRFRFTLALTFAPALVLALLAMGCPDGDVAVEADAGPSGRRDAAASTPTLDAAAVALGDAAHGKDAKDADPDLAPAPVLKELDPSSAAAGGVGPTIAVRGTGFVPRTVVQVDGAVLATTFVSATELRASIPTGKLATPGALRITAGTAPPGGGASAALTFQVVNPVPNLSAIASPSPPSVLMGSPDTTITLAGSKFASNARALFDGVEIVSTLRGENVLDAVIPAAKLVQSGTFDVTVQNPAPGGGSSKPLSFTVTNPTVTLSAISPNQVEIGSPDLVLSLSGLGFLAKTGVSVNGVALAASAIRLIGPTQISATVPATYLASPGDKPVVVINPAPGGGVSTPQMLQVRYPVPSISDFTPSAAIAGDPETVLTITGRQFFPASILTLNNVRTTTTFVNATTIKGTLPADALRAPGPIFLRVQNPAPGGGTGAPVTFEVRHPAPKLDSLTPTSVSALAKATTITLTGSGFVPASEVRANGGAVPTTHVSAGRLTAVLPATLFSAPSVISLTVQNPMPGGGVSAALTLTVSCDGADVDVQLGALAVPATVQTRLRIAGTPRLPRFASAGACPMGVDLSSSQPYRSIIVQNTSNAPALLAAWAVCSATADAEGNLVSYDDAFLTFYRKLTAPTTVAERAACTPVVSEGFNGAGAYSSLEANGSPACPGLNKTNGGAITLGICEKMQVFIQPYFHASGIRTAPLTMKVSLQ